MARQRVVATGITVVAAAIIVALYLDGSSVQTTELPAIENLGDLLLFAGRPPAIKDYEHIAREAGILVLEDTVAPEYRLFKKGSFRLMLVDRHLARMQVAGFFPDAIESDAERKHARSLGIATVSSGEAILRAYSAVLAALSERLGPPSGTGSTAGELYYGFVDDESDDERIEEFEYPYAFWSRQDAVLVLIVTEGDLQIDEWAALDLRIAPASAHDGLPQSVEEPFLWPNDP